MGMEPEAFEDGWNDGWEQGFEDGYAQALKDIKNGVRV